MGIRNLKQDQTQLTSERVAAPAEQDVYTQNLSNSIDVNVDYLHTYPRTGDGPQKELSLSAQYSRNNLTNNFDANNLDSTGILRSQQRNLNYATNQEYILQADYQAPVSKAVQVEFGAKNTFRPVTSDYTYLLAGPTTAFAVDPSRPSGLLDYDQNIAAAYLATALTLHGGLVVKPGLRYEYTSIQARTGGAKTAGTAAGETIPILIPDYGRLMPSINIGKKVGESSSLKLGYTRQIHRPFIDDLNPNFNTANPLNIKIGNPYLKPEIVDRIELGYSTQVKKTYLIFSLYTRLNRDDIQSVSQRSDTLVGAVVTRVTNLGKEYNYGTNLFATINLTPKWSINTNLDIMYRFIQGLALDINGLSTQISNQGFRWGGRFDSQLQLAKGWVFQANVGYRGKDIALQGYRIGFAQYSLGVRKSFTNNRGSVGLIGENFLTQGMRFTSILNSAQFNQDYRQYIYNSSVRATFSYKFGSLNGARVKKNKSISEEN